MDEDKGPGARRDPAHKIASKARHLVATTGAPAGSHGPLTPPLGPQAVPVSDFLGNGGAGQLPRNSQKQKDKEKLRRQKGQSTFSHWKSEAEMVLRQQYDS